MEHIQGFLDAKLPKVGGRSSPDPQDESTEENSDKSSPCEAGETTYLSDEELYDLDILSDVEGDLKKGDIKDLLNFPTFGKIHPLVSLIPAFLIEYIF